MKQHEEVTFQTLADNEDIQVGYSDNDIVVVDSIQQFTETRTAHVAMNAVVICTNGKVQAQMNGIQMVLHKNQVAIVPQNVTVTDVMVSPDFNLKAMFLTNRILQSFLREKMTIWNDMMYIHRQHVVTMDEDEILFYTHFYDMLTLAFAKGKDNPYHTEIIQALLRSAILGLCGAMKWMLSADNQLSIVNYQLSTGKSHFQRFLDLLHSSEIKRHTVESYASELCISPKYLTNTLKEITKKTATQWINSYILQQAKTMLRTSSMNIQQISNALGFENQSHFGSWFRRQTNGTNPTDFRIIPKK